MSELALLPNENFLFDLRIRTEGDDESELTWIPLAPEVLDDRGCVPASTAAILVDAAAGRLAVRSARPRLVATQHIAFAADPPREDRRDATAPAGSPPRALVAEARLLRATRRAIAISLELFEAPLRPEGDALVTSAPRQGVGRSIATFATVDAPFAAESLERYVKVGDGAITTGAPDSRLPAPLPEALGVRAIDPNAGVFELPLTSYVQNHVGALQGGALACLVHGAAAATARAAARAPQSVLDLSIPYLAPGKRGPFRTETRLQRSCADHVVVEVDVHDLGEDGRLMTRATALAYRHSGA